MNYRKWHSHRWSGWPGAFCMLCGCEDPLESGHDEFPFPQDIDNPIPEEQALMDAYYDAVGEKLGDCPGNPDGIDPYTIEPVRKGKT